MTETEIKEAIKSKVYDYLSSVGMIDQIQDSDYTQLLLSLFDLNRKWIPANKRKVLYSKELKQKMKNNKISSEIIELILDFENKFANGENINGHLSTNIYSPLSLDKLLLYWNIHHLHLNDKVAETKNQMHANRSDYYLLFLIDIDCVYFLDCTKHLQGNEFASFDFLNIIFNNRWEKSVPFIEMPHVTGVSFEINDKEQQYQFWKSNINYFIFKYNGKYYGNMSGVMLNGNSIKDMGCVCDLNKIIFYYSNQTNVEIEDINVMTDDCILKIIFKIDNNTKTIEIHNDIQSNIFRL